MADKDSEKDDEFNTSEDPNKEKTMDLPQLTDSNPQTQGVQKVNISPQDTTSVETEAKASLPPAITKNAEFASFLELRDAIEKYQRENSVQLIVKDSKLLKAESTRKIIPKVYHLVNQDLMYHSITYTCKCHGELKQRPGTRMKNVGRNRLNCPMYIRFKLSSDFQKLVLFDLHEEHNHGIDPTTCQMTPRQQVYQLSRMKRKRPSHDDEEFEIRVRDYANLIVKVDENNGATSRSNCSTESSESSEKPESNVITEDPAKDTESRLSPENTRDTTRDDASRKQTLRPESPLDSSSSSFDSDDEEIKTNRRLLPFPIRLIGSAINSNPELIAATKELLEIQKSKLLLEKKKLLMETKLLELTNVKLELEVRQLQKTLSSEASQTQDTTIYLQAP